MGGKRRGRRGSGEGSVYQIANGKWRASLTISFENGKANRKHRIRDTRADAVAALNEMKKQLESGTVPVVAPKPEVVIKPVLTVADFLLDWFKTSVVNKREENTVLSYQNAIKKHLIPRLGHVELSKLEIKTVEDALSAMVVGDAGRRTAQNCFTVLKAALAKAVKWEMSAVNVCLDVDKPTAKRKDIFPFTLEESKRLVDSVAGHIRDEALYRLAITTGLRSGEIFGLHRDAFDLEKKTVRIYQQATEVWGNLRVKALKTKYSIRTIDLPETVIAAVRKQLDWLDTHGKPDCQIVFPNENGGYLRRGTFSRWSWNKKLQALKLKHRGFHHLRHTAATLMLANGVEVAVVTEILGHSSQAVTLTLYGHVLPGRKSRASDTMGGLLG